MPIIETIQEVKAVHKTKCATCIFGNNSVAQNGTSSSTATQEEALELETGGTVKPKTENVSSKRMLQSLRTLQVELPTCIEAKVAADYTGMTPMERFKCETLGYTMTAHGATGLTSGDAVGDPVCFNCLATTGAPPDKQDTKEDTR